MDRRPASGDRRCAGGARRSDDHCWIFYDELLLGDDPAQESDPAHESDPAAEGAWVRRVVRMSSPAPVTSLGSTVFNLNTLPGGKSVVIYPDVESDSEIRFDEIESDDSTPITGLHVLFGRESAPAGYAMVPIDLNRDAGGDDIHLCYTRDPTFGQPITNIRVSINNTTIPAGYEATPNNLGDESLGDLNRGAHGSADIFLFLSRALDHGAPIRMVDIAAGKHVEAPVGWEVLPEDLNNHAGGDYLHLIFTRH